MNDDAKEEGYFITRKATQERVDAGGPERKRMPLPGAEERSEHEHAQRIKHKHTHKINTRARAENKNNEEIKGQCQNELSYDSNSAFELNAAQHHEPHHPRIPPPNHARMPPSTWLSLWLELCRARLR